jgi:hypothetical protein
VNARSTLDGDELLNIIFRICGFQN